MLLVGLVTRKSGSPEFDRLQARLTCAKLCMYNIELVVTVKQAVIKISKNEVALNRIASLPDFMVVVREMKGTSGHFFF